MAFSLLQSLHALIREVRRRKVFQVVLSYAVAAWLVIQIATQTFPFLGLPHWTATLVIILAVLGFPVVGILAWAYELTSEGVRRDVGVPVAADPATATARASGQAGSLEASRHPQQFIDNVPAVSTAFFGRESELTSLTALLNERGERLITVCGPGGAGKTRLALQALSKVTRPRDGICFVALAGVTTAASLPPAIAESLGLAISSREDPRRQLLSYLEEKEMLLVLDNFEQLIEEGELVGELLSAGAGIQILLTSRERLNLTIERVIPIQGLDYPSRGRQAPDGAYGAVQLFLHSARRIEPSFEPSDEDRARIDRLCASLEGLPLAIELAAAWVGTISCAEIEEEIARSRDFLVTTRRDVPDRHRSLRAVFESSWRLLPEKERRTYRRLSVFRGGFDKDAAKQVADASLPILSALLNRSLLRRDEPGRYDIPEVLRPYAQEKLADDPQELAWTTSLHAECFSRFLDALGDQIDGPRRHDTFDRIARDQRNIERAWETAVQRRDALHVDQMVGPLFTFYDGRGRVREGEQLFQGALAAFSTEPSDELLRLDLLRSRLLVRLGAFHFHLGRYQQARELIVEAIEALRTMDEPAETALALERLGQIPLAMGEYEEARRIHLEALDLYRSVGDRSGTARSLVFLGLVMHSLGRYEEAKGLYSESLLILREIGDPTAPLLNLGAIASIEGDYARATELLQESLRYARSSQNLRLMANSLQNLGCVAFQADNLHEAERYLKEGIAICKETGQRRVLAGCLNELAQVTAAWGDVEGAHGIRLEALRLATQLEETPMVLQILIHVARHLAEQRSEHSRAAGLLDLVLQHPASDRQAREVAEALLAEIRTKTGGRSQEMKSGAPAELEDVLRDILSDPGAISSIAR